MHGSYLFGNIKLKWMVVNKVDASFVGDYLPNLAIEQSTTYAYFRQSHKATKTHNISHVSSSASLFKAENICDRSEKV